MRYRTYVLGTMLAAGLLAGCATTGMKQTDVDSLRGDIAQLRTQVGKTDATLQALQDRLNGVATTQDGARAEVQRLAEMQRKIQQQLEALSREARRAQPSEK